MSFKETTLQFFKNIGESIKDYFLLTPRLWKLVGLETFIFATFVGICVIISEGILLIPSSPQTGLNILFAALKVGLSLLLTGIWLIAWYFLTKKLMKNDRNKETKVIKEEK